MEFGTLGSARLRRAGFGILPKRTLPGCSGLDARKFVVAEREDQPAPGGRSPEIPFTPPNMSTLLYDLRYGIRMLLKNPGFTFAALITLARGVASSTVIVDPIVALHAE